MTQSTTARPVLFGHADVGTYGLAHSLLAWARCRLWCDQHGIPMLAPSWLHLQHRIGPLLRREHDNRQYHRLFQFPGYVTGARRLLLLATANRVVAEAANLATEPHQGARRVVVFSNSMRNNEETHFHEVVGHGARIRVALESITKPIYRPARRPSPHIALHVRMGDFSATPSIEALRKGAKNSRIPLEWYSAMLNTLRRDLGSVPAVIYSDGTNEALSGLLSLPNVERSPKQASITDLLGMSQAAALISSGSGFSMWGSYLGSAPRICFPGQRFCRVLGEQSDVDLEPECEFPSDLKPSFISHVRNRLVS